MRREHNIHGRKSYKLVHKIKHWVINVEETPRPILKVQSVYDHKGRPKIKIPTPIARKWGFPKYVLVYYNEKEDKLEIKPYK